MKLALGLMSGTSMDGIDVAQVISDGESHIEFGPTLAIEYPVDIRNNIESGLVDAQQISQRDQRPGSLGELELQITQLHCEAVERFLKINGLAPSEVDLIGFHGQTVLHRPEVGMTVQLGDGELLAQETGIDVVFDMRAADMKANGQGAPLVPVFHQALASKIDCKFPVCFVNIGGISNITYIDADQIVAFDTGPGNTLIDQWVQAKGGIPFDQGGKIGSEGSIVQPILDRYLDNGFFAQSAPKSLDRNDFEALDISKAELSDGARTLARVTAQTIVKAKEHLPETPKTWIICGGGRLNSNIMYDLTDLVLADEAVVFPSEQVELQGDMLEAQAFAYLAIRSVGGFPLTYPKTTGCYHPTTGGVLASSSKGGN